MDLLLLVGHSEQVALFVRTPGVIKAKLKFGCATNIKFILKPGLTAVKTDLAVRTRPVGAAHSGVSN